MYGVSASNSAAQVSTRLKLGSPPAAWRALRTAAGVSPTISAIWTSLKPIRLISSQSRPSSAARGTPSSHFCTSTIRPMWARNHGSMLVSAKTSSSLMPWSRACQTASIRSGLGVRREYRRSSIEGVAAPRGALNPDRPVSSDRRAFWKLSVKVRPIAMASPTLFIWVVSTGLVPGNFSNANRGIFVTT